MKALKVMVTGANGQLGRCFQDTYNKEFDLIALGSDELDITVFDNIIEQLERHQPSVVVNAAAYTAVDKAENEPEKAFFVNAQGAKNLAAACQSLNINLIHVSTDYVFDGKKNQPYKVNDNPNPINIYGKSKLAGELLVLANHQTARIIRTSWVYSEYGSNFLKTMLRLADEGKEELTIVEDQYGCPTYAGNLALAIGYLIQHQPDGRIFHYSDGEIMNWFEFATGIFDLLKTKFDDERIPTLTAIGSEAYQTMVTRPNYSVLRDNITIKNKQRLIEVILKISQ